MKIWAYDRTNRTFREKVNLEFSTQQKSAKVSTTLPLESSILHPGRFCAETASYNGVKPIQTLFTATPLSINKPRHNTPEWRAAK